MPLLSPEIPLTAKVRRDETVAAALAEALLAERVLRESDWDGSSLTSSLGAGISRWAGEQLGGQDLTRIDLGLFWTDHVQATSELDPTLWRQSRGRAVPRPAEGWAGWIGDGMAPQDEPVGLLALRSEHDGEAETWPHHRDVIVGPVVLELEAAREGLGFNLMALLERALMPFVGAAFPHYAYYEAAKYQALTGTVGDFGCPVSPEQVAAVVPFEVLHGSLRAEALRGALKARLSPRHSEIVRTAVSVLDRLEQIRHDARQCDTATLCLPTQAEVRFIDTKVAGMAAKLPAFCVRWSKRDGLPEVLQCYLRQLKGRGTNLAWCQAWVASDPASIRRAAANWRAVTSLVLRACRLAEMLHTEVP